MMSNSIKRSFRLRQITTLLCCMGLSLGAGANPDFKTNIYKIIELTRGEVLIAHTDGNVRRWKAKGVTNKDALYWRINEADQAVHPGKYSIQNLLDNLLLTSKANGHMNVWPFLAKTDDKSSQLFSFEPVEDFLVAVYRGHVQAMSLQHSGSSPTWAELEKIKFYKIRTRNVGEYVHMHAANGRAEVRKLNDTFIEHVFGLWPALPIDYSPGSRLKFGGMQHRPDVNYVDFRIRVGDGDVGYVWAGAKDSTGYYDHSTVNPLDGGIVFKYKTSRFVGADGCSIQTKTDVPSVSRRVMSQRFLLACLAHDTNNEAPWRAAGFPDYGKINGNAQTTGIDVGDFIFYQDMMRLKDEWPQVGQRPLMETYAKNWFRVVNTSHRNYTEHEKYDRVAAGEVGGGIFIVNNTGGALYTKLSWTLGKDSHSFEDTTVSRKRLALPISIGAGDIKLKVYAGRSNATPFINETLRHSDGGMHPFTVWGTSSSPQYVRNVNGVDK